MTKHRSELAASVKSLTAMGLTTREIADLLGLSMAYVYSIREDPAGAARLCTTCVDCGKAATETRCRSCYGKTLRYWTRERIIETVQRWADEHGRPPTTTDWLQSAGLEHPAANTVFGMEKGKLFRYWADVIETAGFPRPMYRTFSRTWDAETILERLRERGQELGRTPTRSEVDSTLLAAAQRHFGGWILALREAGLEVNRPAVQRNLTELDLLIEAFPGFEWAGEIPDELTVWAADGIAIATGLN